MTQSTPPSKQYFIILKIKIMTVLVNVVKSFAGLKAISDFIKVNRTSSFEVKESNGKIWENFGGFNGNMWDLWLRKKGTQGATSKTFIRAYVKEETDINQQLRWWGFLPKLTDAEKADIQAKADADFQAQKELIKAKVTKEDAAKWIANDEGNSHTRRTRWGNRSERIGATRSNGNYLRSYCHELTSIND